MRLRLFQFLLVLALLVSEAAGGVRLGRNRDFLLIPQVKAPLFYDVNGIGVSIDAGIHLYANLEPDDPWFWVRFDQSASGLVEINFGQRWNEATATETHHFCSFAAALESDYGDLVTALFCEIGQGQVCCSRRFIRLRDGLEEPLWGDEFVFACQRLFDMLDDPDWRVRDEATRTLANLGDDAVLWLAQHDHANLSPETEMRMEIILSHYPL